MKIETKEILKNCIRVTTTDERWYIKDKDTYTSSTWIASYVPSKELAIWMAKMGLDEAELVKRESGAKGSRVHKGCEVLGSGGVFHNNDSYSDGEGDIVELTAQEYEGILSFKAFCDEVKPEIIATEKTVFNKKYMYAGTLDTIMKIKDRYYVVDYKTSANIYLSHKAQISSYLHSDDIRNYFSRTSGKIIEGMAILQLGYNKNQKGWKFTEIEDEFDSFLAAKHFWYKANKNVKPKQKDYPLKIEGIK